MHTGILFGPASSRSLRAHDDGGLPFSEVGFFRRSDERPAAPAGV